MGSVKGTARRWWLKVHRWTALSLGLPLALVALLGSLLVVARPLDRALHPELFAAGPGAASPWMLETARQALAREFPRAALTLRPPREAGDTLQVMVRGDWRGTVWFDPATLEERGRRGEHEGFVNAVFELHSSLLMDDAGKAVLAVIALSYLALLATGAVLWWPTRWSQALKVALDRGALRAWLDLHRTGGAVLGLALAVSIASGAYMAWRPLSQAVTHVTGETPVRPPVVPEAAAASSAKPLDSLVAIARREYPLGENGSGYVGYVQWAGAQKPLRVRLKLPDDPHPNGLTSVWLHPSSGEVLARQRWNTLDPGARAFSVIYPLHTGQLGGPVHEAFNLLLGMTTFGLGVTGLWLWWRRRGSTSRSPGTLVN
jgi:uncharacterized iron-regulated membrane protein